MAFLAWTTAGLVLQSASTLLPIQAAAATDQLHASPCEAGAGP